MQVNGTIIPNVTASYLSFTATLANSGTYTVSAVNIVGQSESTPMLLTVNVAPVFVVQPSSITQQLHLGNYAFFTTNVSGTAPVSVQWRVRCKYVSLDFVYFGAKFQFVVQCFF